MASKERDKASPSYSMPTDMKRGSGEPRAITGAINLNASPETIEAQVAEKAQIGRKVWKSQAAREASMMQIFKAINNPNNRGSRGSDKSVPGKLPHGLTIRQEQFCQNVMAGMTHAQAYRDAYNCHNLKPAVVYSRAYTVATNQRVVKRLEILWQQREGRLSHTPAQLRLFVQERLMIEALREDNPASVRVRSVELIGKIGRVRLFESDGEKAPENQSVDDLMKRIAPLLELGKAMQAQVARTEKPKQIKDTA